MKVIIDANVAIAAAASRGLCEAVMELCLERHRIVLCKEILDDMIILGLVKPSKANFIITGDKDLLVLGSYLNAKIVSPRQFWDEHNKSGMSRNL